MWERRKIIRDSDQRWKEKLKVQIEKTQKSFYVLYNFFIEIKSKVESETEEKQNHAENWNKMLIELNKIEAFVAFVAIRK